MAAPGAGVDSFEFDIFTGAVRIACALRAPARVRSGRLVGGSAAFPLRAAEREGRLLLEGTVAAPVDIPGDWLVALEMEDGRHAAFAARPALVPTPAPPAGGVVLSVCIPTFNRALRCLDAVRSVLACPDPRIEVVVSNNASEDDTLGRLAEVKDPRLRVRGNERNIGPIRNFNAALHAGRGRFVMLHSDEDTVSAEHLPAFLGFLEGQPGLACGIASVAGGLRFPETRLFSRGRSALMAVGKPFSYLGGFFFRRSELDFGRLFGEYFNPSYLYPFENLLWELCLKGDVAFYAPDLVAKGKNDRSFFPRTNDRHFNHPVCLVDQSIYRKDLFRRIAGDCLTQAELGAILGAFEDQVTRQNFGLSYEIPLAEKMELMFRLLSHTGIAFGHPSIQSLLLLAAAEFLSGSGDPAQAAPLAAEAAERDPRNITALFLLADLRERAGDPAGADQAYQRVVSQTDNRWPFLLRSFNRLLGLGRLSEAGALLRALESPDARTPDFILPQVRERYAAITARPDAAP